MAPTISPHATAPKADHFGTRRKISPKAIGTVTGILNRVKKACIRLKMPKVLETKSIASAITVSPMPSAAMRPAVSNCRSVSVRRDTA